jgi:predicted AlkP superfamily phosphohydrolase/phosphomutase
VETPARLSLDWMPATRYRPFWHRMDAFALPSFYDGRIRVNLTGRERSGRIQPSDYARVLDDIEALLRECRDPQSGEGIVELVERPSKGDPIELGPTESDMVVVWKGCSPSLAHPTLGTVGPVPLRRTGGHTGPFGMACLRGENITPGDRGIRSAFDVVPTIVDLLSEPAVAGMSGRSLLA